MLIFQIKDVSLFDAKKSISIVDNEGNTIADILKTSVPENEKDNTFFLKQNNKEAVLGIKKGRVLFATYRFQIDGEEFTFKDNTINSILYFCVDGMIHGKKLRFEENWNEEIDVKLAGKKVALIKPKPLSLGATILIDEEISHNLQLFSLTCLMYFMFKVYKKETDVIESIIDELI